MYFFGCCCVCVFLLFFFHKQTPVFLFYVLVLHVLHHFAYTTKISRHIHYHLCKIAEHRELLHDNRFQNIERMKTNTHTKIVFQDSRNTIFIENNDGKMKKTARGIHTHTYTENTNGRHIDVTMTTLRCDDKIKLKTKQKREIIFKRKYKYFTLTLIIIF